MNVISELGKKHLSKGFKNLLMLYRPWGVGGTEWAGERVGGSRTTARNLLALLASSFLLPSD